MKVQNSNLHTNNNTNFTAIKSIECSGLYKKYPNLANELVDTFQRNQKAMDFCKKYDVDIVFHAMRTGVTSVESSMHMFYDDITKCFVRKFFESIFEDGNIQLRLFSDKYNVVDSLKDSTKVLKEAIISNTNVQSTKTRNGMLDLELKLADEDMQKVISKKTQKLQAHEMKIQAKKAKAEAKNDAKNKLKEDTEKLNDSIQNLIKNSK